MSNTLHAVATVLAALVLTLATGVWNGQLSHRWGPPRTAEQAAVRLQELPKQFGDWLLDEEYALDPQVAEILRCNGYVNRQYVNQVSGETVRVVVLLGPSGPVSVHTPEICYSGAGYVVPENANRMEVESSDGVTDVINRLTLTSASGDQAALVVGYGWTAANTFEVPSSPRWKYRNELFLYKIQFATSVMRPTGMSTAEADAADQAIAQKFLREFLPALRPYLASSQQ